MVEVPAEQVEQEMDKLARAVCAARQGSRIPPGKVPLNMIKQRYRAEMRNDATQEIIQRSWKEAVEKHASAPLTGTVVQDLKDDPGNPLKFTLVFEILPADRDQGLQRDPGSASQHCRGRRGCGRSAGIDLREQQCAVRPGGGRRGARRPLVTMTVDGLFEEGGKPLQEEDVT